MATRSAKDILQQLDKALAESCWKGPPSDLSHLSEPDHLEDFKQLANYEQTISKCISEKASQLVEAKSLNTLRVCSIGCADGTFDTLCLEDISRKHPTLCIHYVGINADEQMHELAEETVHMIGGNITAELVTEDYHELKKENFSSFDLILMVNPQFSCIYDVSEVEPLMKVVLGMLKPNGQVVVISSSCQSFNELITRLWKHQRKHDLCTTEFLTSALQKMGCKYAMEQEPLNFDLSRCVDDKFKSAYGKLILDHLVLARLEEFDPRVSQLCVDYLTSIAQENGVIVSLCDVIVVSS